nr:MAG TPA: hypothetical protein [Caudoviricetes sp.]
MKSIKQWVVVHFATELKIFTIFIMLLTLGVMLYDRHINDAVMPNFYQVSKDDWWFWFIANLSGVIVNITLLINTKCIKCRLLSDLMLQLSGFLILLMGWAFLAAYPPLNAFMVLYPIWGILIIVAGRHMGKANRELHQQLG